MFQTLSLSKLEELINQFSVPMFIVERNHPAGEFILSGLNRASQDVAGLCRTDLLGLSLNSLTSTGMPEDAISHYHTCAQTGETIRFSYNYCHDGGEVRWDTTLQYVASHGTRDRIIATAINIRQERAALQDLLAFDDLRYFSSIADLHLENLNSAFSSTYSGPRVTPMDEERVMRLHAVCRTIQRSVSDIAEVVRRAQVRHASQANHAMLAPINLARNRSGPPQMDTVRAISAVAGM